MIPLPWVCMSVAWLLTRSMYIIGLSAYAHSTEAPQIETVEKRDHWKANSLKGATFEKRACAEHMYVHMKKSQMCWYSAHSRFRRVLTGIRRETRNCFNFTGLVKNNVDHAKLSGLLKKKTPLVQFVQKKIPIASMGCFVCSHSWDWLSSCKNYFFATNIPSQGKIR